MKLIYSNENKLLVHNVKNILEAEGIDVFIKNEFAQGAMGEVAVFDTWPELWINDEADFERASVIVEGVNSKANAADWMCNNCQEVNDASFEVCWKCQEIQS